MGQPIKNGVKNTSKPKKTVKKKKQSEDKRIPPAKNKPRKRTWRDRKHAEFGTSKLEERFAKNILEKIGVEYIYQYKAESIGRYYDFLVKGNEKHPTKRIAIEVDGDYYHSYGIVYEEMNPMQKRNKRVDEIKNKWCSRNGIPLIRLWEHDINKHPEKVLEYLKEALCDCIPITENV